MQDGLVIHYGQNDSVKITGQFGYGSYNVSQFQFSDGVTMSMDELFSNYAISLFDPMNAVFTGNSNFKLYGSEGNDLTITGLHPF